jgi:ankyrin repeat protein
VTEPLDEATLAFARQMFDLAREGSTEQLAGYVDAGVPVNLTTATGDTLLLLAAYHDHPETVRALLARGAEPDRVNDRGQTPLAAAVFRRSEPSVTALLGAGADPDAGSPTARETATFFQLPEMTSLLGDADPGSRG